MDEITLSFNVTLNISLQPGDILFYKDISSGDVYQIGEASQVTGTTVVCDIDPSTPRPVAGDFIFFAKDSEINLSGVLGYYASVKMKLSGSAKKELYSVSTEMFQSS